MTEIFKMPMPIIVHAGSDEAFIAWNAEFIPDCRGFALYRRIKRSARSAPSPNTASQPDARGFATEIVASWVGFAEGPDVAPGTREPTTKWPIQKYLWSDFAVNDQDVVSYRVVPMVGRWNELQERQDLASEWSDTVTIGSQRDKRTSCFFNRGIVASQWLARLLPSLPDPKADTRAKGRELEKSINSTDNEIRNFLAGPLREKPVRILDECNKARGHIHAALFELNDPELIPLLQSFGKRAHVILGNGSVKKKGEDENKAARNELQGVCDLHNRFSAPRALAHNKFLVICDRERKALAVWTGSTNWTTTGLCTQANNGLFIDIPAVAAAYLQQWTALLEAGDDTPDDLRASDETPKTKLTAAPGTTIWFTPLREQSDLEYAGALIAAAKDGILFAMFNPGPRGTLLNDIIELASPASAHYKPDLYIQGVLNQDPGTEKNPVSLFNRGTRIDSNADVVLPAAIDMRLKFWVKELEKMPRAHAMVHSKVVVIDPFGAHPVLMTGSHNMGPKASGVNDENLVIIEGDRILADQYATKIMEIYNQYRWRASQHKSSEGPRWSGLADNDKWQIGAPGADTNTQAYDRRRQRELSFWFGK
jgi:phosphatidylserine/phosphatidylglycerophosphate/cardiolipin synthase-like enzyme